VIKVVFCEVRVSAIGSFPLLILKEAHGSRKIAISISAAAGAAILSALEAEDEEHPSTHDLMLEALATQDAVVEAVHVLSENGGLYHAQLLVNGTALTCRVSDGVALAIRCGAPILVAKDLLTETEVQTDPAVGTGSLDNPDAEVEQFREFLDSVNPDDFEDEP
jgi:bifunctional DNase/RNase